MEGEGHRHASPSVVSAPMTSATGTSSVKSGVVPEIDFESYIDNTNSALKSTLSPVKEEGRMNQASLCLDDDDFDRLMDSLVANSGQEE